MLVVIGIAVLMVGWIWLYGRKRPGHGKPLRPIPASRWRVPVLVALAAMPLEMLCMGLAAAASDDENTTATLIGLTLGAVVLVGFVLSVRRIYAVLGEYYG